jgi:hypothetical protein
MELYEKVAQEIVKDISGEYEKYDTIKSLELFLKKLQEMEDPRVTEQLVLMLPTTEIEKLCSQINIMKQEGSNSEKQIAKAVGNWSKGRTTTIKGVTAYM